MSALPQVVIALHQTRIPENIGSVCRVIGNLGLSRLILIEPLCEVNIKSQSMAVGCQDLLSSRLEYKDWSAFLENENGLRIAFSARKGKERENNQADFVFENLIRNSSQGGTPLPKTVYLIFGREDSGLSADDLLNCHHTCSLPIDGRYKSLNLSHAVFLAGFLWRQKLKTSLGDNSSPSKVCSEQSYQGEFDPILREWLETLGFDLSAPKTNAFRVMKKLFLKNQPTDKEIKILHSVLRQNVRKLKNRAKEAN